MNRLPLDAEAIRALAEILTETGLTEIEVAEKDIRIRVVRAPAQAIQAFAPATHVAPPAAQSPGHAAGPAHAPGHGHPDPALPVDYAKHPGAVTSPMVGIAYLSPEPGSTPYVAEGQTVTAGQTLLLIEAMKTFNQIKATRSGTLTKLLVASGSPVEYGEPLAVIE